MERLRKENDELKIEIENLKKGLQETKVHLQKYTFSNSHKVYKEKNKEKNKEYAKQYYQKKKLLKQENKNDKI